MVPSFWPTRPPAMMPVKLAPLTLPLTITLLIVPELELVPARMAMRWLGAPAATCTFSSLRSRIMPELVPMSAGPATTTLLILWIAPVTAFLPSKIPVKVPGAPGWWRRQRRCRGRVRRCPRG